jgi:2'-5' RNA ligase
MQIGYGILVEEEIFNYMREKEVELFKKFGLEAGLKQPPHITIKPPFEAEDLELHFKYIEKLAKEIDPFEISIKGFNHFGNKVIYLDVMHNEKLFALNKKITLDLHESKDEMIFHSTIAYSDINNKEFQEAYDMMIKKPTPEFKFKFNKIGLFYKLSSDSGWIILKKITLNKTI